MMDKNSDEMERIGEAVMASKERHQEYIWHSIRMCGELTFPIPYDH